MSEFPYTPLNAAEKSIRILRIQMGYWRDDIVCFLVESYASQEEGFGYNALSYTWGGLEHTLDGVEHPPHIFLDWHKFEVGENLYWAIQYIRRADKDVYLWVDAICINQEDEQEKGHQVKQMGEIYSAAEEVFIWLGPSNDDIGVLMEWITSIDVQATEAQAIGNNEDWISLCSRFMDVRPDKPSQISRSRQIGALTELLGRPWFNRVWILQEVAKARTAKILCGIFSCPARTFAQMPSLMGLKITEHTQAVLDIMSRTRKNSWWSRKRYLHFLLIKFEKSHASVVRDKVYASLGMSEDVGNPERFYPCYQKTDNQVFRDTVCFL
ncbi:heterokaryon incompatibility protein-domain-containing protein, partial [Truncatella angustata]